MEGKGRMTAQLFNSSMLMIWLCRIKSELKGRDRHENYVEMLFSNAERE